MLQLAGVGLVVASAVTLGLGVGVGATEPASGSIVPSSAVPVSPFTANTPFSSGQNINVVIPANSAFAGSNVNINIVECAAPGGVPPTDTSQCDGNTIQGNTIIPNADGSFTYDGFTLFALPDLNFEGASGPACGLTAGAECILYIGNDQNDFTQPHLWSQPFFIGSNGGVDSGANPGDGSAPAVASTPSASLSTVVASPSTATADGVDLSTVTVTLNATGPVPVAGKAVTLACISPACSASISAPSSATTDANGQTTFNVTDTTAGSATLQATDTTDANLVLTQTATVTFQARTVSATHSTVTATPATVTSGSTTITVTLRDQGASPQPVAGQTVTLAGTGSAVIVPTATPNVTDAAGHVTFTATDPDVESVTFTATDATENDTVITNTAKVTFGTLTVSSSESTVTASSPALVASGSSTGGTSVVVTLLSASDSAVAGKVVTLHSSGTAMIGDSSPSQTGSNGQASFTLTDTVAESVTVTATDSTDGITLTPTATVVFTAGGSASATTSTMTAQSPTSPADGETQTLITVTLKDQFGGPVPGSTITIQGAPAGNVEEHPIAVGSSTPGVTDPSGVAEFEVLDSHVETVVFTATDTTDNNLVLSPTVSITFLVGAADPTGQGTTVTVAPANPPSDGSTPSVVTVTLADQFSNPVSGKTIGLVALNGKSVITPVNAVTDQAGQATFNATDSSQEVVTYQATDVTDGNAVLTAEGVVTFGSPPSPAAVAADCDVVANPSSVPADGTHTATISVLLYDGNGDQASGKTVTLSASAGGSTVVATNAMTNSSGMANFTVSDTTAEKVTYTADDTSDGVTLTGIPVTVTFTTASASATTTTTTTSTTAPSGTTTTTTVAGGVVVGSSSAGLGNTGNTGAGATTPSSTSSLADTGASALLPWLIGFGALFLIVGTIGRRRFKGEQHEA